MIKDVIVHLEHDATRDAVRDYALSIAEKFDVYLAGVAFGYVANIPSFVLPDFPAEILADLAANTEMAARGAIERFDAAVKRSGISAESRLLMQSEFGPPRTFAAMGRRFDLSVIMQSDDDSGASNDSLIEAALFDSGRPLIVVPYIQKGGLELDHIICCWDGGRAAARALNDALPLLKKARVVDLLIVANEKTDYAHVVRGAEVAKHLGRHDVKVEVKIIPAADIDVANTILSYVADRSASMIVMGGYGHSRLREFVLGGTTREILSTMTVPVFMSH
jgi:nucleotide-binding universal stress UspA family protein